ncbi:MAG: hypothetical protein FXF49_05905 [Flexistipes sinusarabici]|uniref:Uncharacterized protein n=1 Tax=Flexistipes sinusarabici TaxID=2352 RepID=A0A5D0MIN2_FLESI|nr:hypothetical protein [Flexistipes sinusarabici]TYB33537.1 MAG: hypothetical protein FXF49_05905 [Flexistipes sinusarabici]
MAYENIRFVKLVTGDSVMGEQEEETGKIKNIALIQAIPSGNSMQVAVLPFGFPFEEEIGGEISEKDIIYEYSSVPEELRNKYLEAKSNIRISQNMDNLKDFQGGPGSGGNSGLII